MRKYVTMSDIAEIANVSVNTVSRVLNGKGDISRETVEKILKIARELGYVKDMTASSLRSKKTKIVGVILEDVNNPFFAELLTGIETAAVKKGYQLLVMNTSVDVKREREAIKTLLERRVEGILITPTEKNFEDLEELSKMSFPTVVVGRHVENMKLDQIYSDEVKGGYLATKHLLSLGRRNLLFVTDDLRTNSAAKFRYKGFTKALEEERLTLNQDYVQIVSSAPLKESYEVVQRIVKMGLMFDGVVCYNDILAIGVMKALRDLGKEIPGDVAVVGYDDIDFARYLEPSLTSVRINKFRMGYEAFKILLERINKKRKKPKVVVLDVELVVRESTDITSAKKSQLSL